MMKNEFIIRNANTSDINDILSIFNYYIKNSFAAYLEDEVKTNFFHDIMQTSQFFYILELGTRTIGFAFLKNYLPYKNFEHTGQITYFINEKHTNKGLGTLLLNKLIKDAKEHGISILLVNLSSLNQSSLNFHKKHGFVECGRFKNIGKKFNHNFDIIWMQRNL
ncbi:MAG: GNAT family N-acetyltransferase [Candidatus Hodarchaeota archaeon]